jgi:hypothetical protein
MEQNKQVKSNILVFILYLSGVLNSPAVELWNLQTFKLLNSLARKI